MVANKAKKPVKNTTVSDCGGIKPEKLFSPKDENKSKAPKKQGQEITHSTVSGFPLAVFLYSKRGETICSLTDSSMNSNA